MARSRYKSKRGVQRVKLLFIISGILVILVPVLILVLIKREDTSKSVKVNRTASPTVSVNKDLSTENQTPTLPPFELLETYTSQFFRISYPKDWKVEQFPLEGGSDSILVKPAFLPYDALIPGIVVTVSDISESESINNKAQFFVDKYGFRKDLVYIQGLPASRIYGTFKASEGVPLQEKQIYLDKGQYTYVIVYRYAGNQQQLQFEGLFDIFVERFQFLQ